MNISTYRNPVRVSGVSFEGKTSKTQRNFREAADINNIIAKYRKTGILGDPLSAKGRSPVFADFTQVKDYQSAQIAVAQSKSLFHSLSAKDRAMFDNDVSKFLSFVADPANDQALQVMGLKEKDRSKVRYINEATGEVKNIKGEIVGTWTKDGGIVENKPVAGVAGSGSAPAGGSPTA